MNAVTLGAFWSVRRSVKGRKDGRKGGGVSAEEVGHGTDNFPCSGNLEVPPGAKKTRQDTLGREGRKDVMYKNRRLGGKDGYRLGTQRTSHGLHRRMCATLQRLAESWHCMHSFSSLLNSTANAKPYAGNPIPKLHAARLPGARVAAAVAAKSR